MNEACGNALRVESDAIRLYSASGDEEPGDGARFHAGMVRGEVTAQRKAVQKTLQRFCATADSIVWIAALIGNRSAVRAPRPGSSGAVTL